jgi:hypothetical protein
MIGLDVLLMNTKLYAGAFGEKSDSQGCQKEWTWCIFMCSARMSKKS